MRWVSAGPLSSLRFDPGAVIVVEGHELAVFPIDHEDGGGYAALLNSCPHAGASLAEGTLRDGELTCPWHGWRFDVRTGACSTIADDSTRAFPVRIADGDVWVGFDE